MIINEIFTCDFEPPFYPVEKRYENNNEEGN
jgi:hypothetical protein